MADEQQVDVWPTPRRVERGAGSVTLRPDRWCVVGQPGSFAAEIVARRLGAPLAGQPAPGLTPVRMLVQPDAEFARGLSRDQRPEAYTLEVRPDGVTALAAEPEGLLRAAATVLQLARDANGGVALPMLSLTDYPAFRFRCAADWLINVECNRWAYDWGDGLEAVCARLERKLDQCFRYKINQVWFDGFGWDLDRTPHYAELVRHCTGYARRRGIRLTFAGYAAGYGTAYQRSEIYRCGYHGQVYLNRRPYPDGPEYLCCGMAGHAESRRYGTCPSNEALQAAKLAELERFVSVVQPGFLYLHDIDTGTFEESRRAWLLRCDDCRRRWPSDELTDLRGQAGALALWFRRVRDHLGALPADGDYDPARDLTLIFTSPVYSHRLEPGQPEVWRREVEYFGLLSSLIGPAAGVEFAIREQLLDPDGTPRVGQLRRALDQAGCGHGVHVIAFAGGDNYNSDDLTNVSATMAPVYSGAESVCLSNGGVHEDPVQLLNAELLWAGAASPWAECLTDAAAADALFDAVASGTHRPESIFGEGGLLHRACERLWGEAAGGRMRLAYLSGDPTRGPVARIWWTITREVRRLAGDVIRPERTPAELHELWLRRTEATEQALVQAEAAQALTHDPDVAWFAHCLEVGRRFAVVLAMSYGRRDGEADDGRLGAALDELEAYLDDHHQFAATDVLGGDPGSWRETLALLRDLAIAAG